MDKNEIHKKVVEKWKAERERVINHEAPVEKYILELPVYPDTQITAKNEVGAIVLKFPSTSMQRRHFNGRTKVKVKAKIIDGTFTILKYLT